MSKGLLPAGVASFIPNTSESDWGTSAYQMLLDQIHNITLVSNEFRLRIHCAVAISAAQSGFESQSGRTSCEDIHDRHVGLLYELLVSHR